MKIKMYHFRNQTTTNRWLRGPVVLLHTVTLVRLKVNQMFGFRLDSL